MIAPKQGQPEAVTFVGTNCCDLGKSVSFDTEKLQNYSKKVLETCFAGRLVLFALRRADTLKKLVNPQFNFCSIVG